MFITLDEANEKLWDIPVLSYYEFMEIKILSVEKDNRCNIEKVQ